MASIALAYASYGRTSLPRQPARPCSLWHHQAIGELICNHPGEITLIATGPLTNVAIALQLYPDIVGTVKNIVIMGGVFNVAGYIKDTNFGFGS
ncbi:Pyrimidine-specific ribonucleoside hydrolase rihB [Raoultella planticola]|uniref:Pyrimidine-specific ribonucleoside hydrolase rihB n=1 Tax=Raoultella planticola TaxID=575 RepID=A0A485DBR9_RAOPL|nr:Pyrimidine-specific ribonucleoside hydrolase rihB [Raoultella planticola]